MRTLRKSIIAATAAVALIAGQATAAGVRVNDRIGTAAEKNDDRVIPIALTALAAGIVLMVLVNGSQGDDSESD